MAKINLLYLGYVGFNNLGDEVCYQAFLQMLKPYASKVHIIVYDLAYKPAIKDIHRDTPLAGVILGGGSLLQGTAFVEPASQAAALHLPLFLFGTGIDYFDESYAQSLMDENKPATAPGMFDGKELSEAAITRIIKGCHGGGVRGPLTERFISRLDPSKKIGVMGDSGLIYTPKNDASILGVLLSSALSEKKIAAVNWGSSLGCVYGYDEQRTMIGLAEGIRMLINRGYEIVIYPMWDNDIEPCRKLLQATGRPGICKLVSYVPTIDAICTLLKSASLSIGLKLHANVLSACMGTPFLSLAYRSKCYDFAHSVGMLSHCVSTASFHINDFIAKHEALMLKQREEISSKIKTHRIEYQKKYATFTQHLVKHLHMNL